MTKAKPKPKRDKRGRLLKGEVLNPGGRHALPADFKAFGSELLEQMLDIALTPKHRRHYDALLWCVEKIYGKPRQDLEVTQHGPPAAVVAMLQMIEARQLGRVQAVAELVAPSPIPPPGGADG